MRARKCNKSGPRFPVASRAPVLQPGPGDALAPQYAILSLFMRLPWRCQLAPPPVIVLRILSICIQAPRGLSEALRISAERAVVGAAACSAQKASLVTWAPLFFSSHKESNVPVRHFSVSAIIRSCRDATETGGAEILLSSPYEASLLGRTDFITVHPTTAFVLHSGYK